MVKRNSLGRTIWCAFTIMRVFFFFDNCSIYFDRQKAREKESFKLCIFKRDCN